jgi:hypothetical protein
MAHGGSAPCPEMCDSRVFGAGFEEQTGRVGRGARQGRWPTGQQMGCTLFSTASQAVYI